MTRGISSVLGVGLLVLWLVGLGSPNSPMWFVWLDGIAGALAFLIAAAAGPNSSVGARVTGPIALSLGLFALWIIGLASSSPGWLTWWTFAFACSFMLLGFSGRGNQPLAVSGKATPTEEERNRFRRSA